VVASFATLAFVREGNSPPAELQTLVIPAVWATAAPALTVLALCAALGAFLYCRSGRTPSILRAALIAAAATSGFAFAYGWCQDTALTFLPELGGCHCWIVGASGALAGVAVALVAAIARVLVGRALAHLAGFVRGILSVAAAGAGPALVVPLSGTLVRQTGRPAARHRALRAPPLR
jgi:hypothetical protein